jgi:Ni,Fe-hydrogenase III small subunit
MKLAPYRKKSPWILHYNAGGCNGCDIEILACLSPKYDIERFGMINTGNPKQSDILLVTGPVTKRSRERLVEIYAQMPEPKVVISCGACACTGGVFRGMYNCEGGVDQYIPVDVYVCGCGTRPEQIIDGVIEGLAILENKSKEREESMRLKKEAVKEGKQVNRRNIADKIKPALS